MTVDKSDGSAVLSLTSGGSEGEVHLIAGKDSFDISLQKGAASVGLFLAQGILGTGISIHDQNNVDRLYLNIDSRGSHLGLYGPDGKQDVIADVDQFSSSIIAGNGAGTGKDALIAAVSPKGEPSLTLSDAQGRDRAVLGTVDLQNAATGSTEHRSPSSLVLFGEDGKVVWSSP
jgi:hypothetical protein